MKWEKENFSITFWVKLCKRKFALHAFYIIKTDTQCHVTRTANNTQFYYVSLFYTIESISPEHYFTLHLSHSQAHSFDLWLLLIQKTRTHNHACIRSRFVPSLNCCKGDLYSVSNMFVHGIDFIFSHYLKRQLNNKFGFVSNLKADTEVRLLLSQSQINDVKYI